MITATDDPTLSEFASAADEAPVASIDVLDRIEAWVKTSASGIAKMRAGLGDVLEGGADLFSDSFPEYAVKRGCDPDRVAKEVWEIAAQAVNRRYVTPQKVEVKGIEEFLREAFARPSSRGSEEAAECDLAAWNAQKIRAHFAATFGDVREAGIRQLRERVLNHLNHDKRPGEVLQTWCSLHERTSRGERMRFTYESGKTERFDDILRYVAHLATGAAPADIELGHVFGFNDGAREWHRKELFKRQKSPSAGVLWLRFTADYYVEMALEPTVLARLQTQWDEVHGKDNS